MCTRSRITMVTVSCRLSIQMGTLIRKFYAKGVDATAMSDNQCCYEAKLIIKCVYIQYEQYIFNLSQTVPLSIFTFDWNRRNS